MDNKKMKITQIIRHIIQLLSFIFLPGLFILVWNSIGEIYKSILLGNFTFSQMSSQLLILLAVIPITILWGRFFCGYMCAFGSMQEFFNIISKKLKIKQLKIDSKYDKYLKYFKFVVLAIFIILWTAKVSIDTKFTPWGVFGIYTNISGWTDFSYLLGLGGLILLVIIISSLFIDRAFCKYFCPLGVIFSIISKPRLYKIKKSQSKCVGCNLCTMKCPMNIDVNGQTNEFGKIKSGECIDCFECVNLCNSEALYTSPKEAVSATIAPIAIAGMYYLGNVATNGANSVTNITNDISVTQGKYTNGTYEGSGQGYRGTVNVKVKVSDGKITSITIESYKDDDQFFNKAKTTIINEIISKQDTDVDTVSGATFSSKGIISAVADALSGKTSSSSTTSNITNNSSVTTTTNSSSMNNSNSSGNTSTTNTSNASNSISTSTSNSGSSISTANASNTSSTSTNFSNLTDGTYEGTGTGRNGNIKVSVKVSGGKVSSITIESYVDDEQYFSRAKSTIINEIISNQSLDVQTVSGATMSSNGIIAAVANALGINYTNANSTMQSMNQGHGRMH